MAKKDLDALHDKVDQGFERMETMMTQLVKIVGETNRKVTEMQDEQAEIRKELLRIAKQGELHKRKIADLEESVNELKPLDH